MEAERSRLSNNMAGIEFAACLEAIKEFLEKSWKHSQIHRHLKQEGRITMPYGAFCYHMRRLSPDKRRPRETPPQPKPKAAPVAPVRPHSGPRRIATPSNQFPNPRDMNYEDAI